MYIATAAVIKNLPTVDSPGKGIKLSSKDDRFEYLNPPMSSETRQQEKSDLKESILFDTFTPEFTPEKWSDWGLCPVKPLSAQWFSDISSVIIERDIRRTRRPGKEPNLGDYDECNSYPYERQTRHPQDRA